MAASTARAESPAIRPEPAVPLLSLCLATYNRERYLHRYLTHHIGALDAAGIDYELVVSDNCSTDETPAILAKYAEQNPRVRVTRQPHNLGAYPNILTTLRRARGELVVSISDDDLAIPEQLIDYVGRLERDPALVMVQAPWFLTDERKGNAVIGKFYDFEGDWRFERGQFGGCLAFLLQNHAFPECFVVRRSALPSIAGPMPRFTYGFFTMLANALMQGDVLFTPEPHIKATAIAEGGNAHVGNTEAMEAWDTYRGGLELMVSYARQFNPGALPAPSVVAEAVSDFVHERMGVAARLQAHAKNWANAYQILRRLHAYEALPDIGIEHDVVARLAAVETALLECAQLGAAEIVADANVPDHILERMNPIEGVRIIRAEAISANDGRRAFCVIGEPPKDMMRPHDFACDIAPVMDRFPIFPGQA